MKKTRKYLAGVESLESRAVLSVAHPAAHVVALQGAGTMATTGTKNVATGVQATVQLDGTFNGLGRVAGPLTINVVTGGHKFDASGTITLADGDTLGIHFVGKDQVTRPHQTRAVGRFHFNVTGGTGAFLGATGGGTITITQVLATGAETFTINGKARG